MSHPLHATVLALLFQPIRLLFDILLAMSLAKIYKEIEAHPSNKHHRKKGYRPVYSAHKDAKIVIIGQTPGRKAQESSTPWNDLSGDTLRKWLGVDRETFYTNHIALVPMDFYYPGKGKHGDLPPRKEFAGMWHERIFKEMPHVELVILVGSYSQQHYLKEKLEKNLTETVRKYKKYLPDYFVLVHPSPLNLRWRAKNKWFEKSVVPELRKRVAAILDI